MKASSFIPFAWVLFCNWKRMRREILRKVVVGKGFCLPSQRLAWPEIQCLGLSFPLTTCPVPTPMKKDWLLYAVSDGAFVQVTEIILSRSWTTSYRGCACIDLCFKSLYGMVWTITWVMICRLCFLTFSAT